MYNVLRFVEHCYVSDPTLRMAQQRVVSYFLTKINLIDAADEEKEKIEDFLTNDLKIMKELMTAGTNYMCYGNDFISLSVPFRRHLRCPKCFIEKPISKWDYRWIEWDFRGECKCGYDGKLVRVDRRSIGQDPIQLIHWPAHEIRIQTLPVPENRVRYLWRLPPVIRTELNKGNKFYLEFLPWDIVDTARHPNHLFGFADGTIYHLRSLPPSGIRHFGWGIPLMFSCYRAIWQLRTLKRYNEAICADFIVPFRVITPSPGTSKEADPVLHANLASFNSRTLSMFASHRRDPCQVQCLPFPIEFQMLGAEGQALAPTDLITAATDELLNGLGVPGDFYRGTLQLQVAPVAIRMFERTWVHFVSELNDLLQWIVDQVSELQNWEKVKVRLQSPTMADDLEKKQILLSLAAGNQISRGTAFAPLNINWTEEIQKMLAEEGKYQEAQAEHQERMQQKAQLQQTVQSMVPPPNMPDSAIQQATAQQGQPQPGGQPAQGAAGGAQGQPGVAGPVSQLPQSYAPTMGTTPDDLLAQAEQIAIQLLSMPYELRRGELMKIKKSNETLHAQVLAKMNSMRSQAKSQGGFQLMQQQLGPGAQQ